MDFDASSPMGPIRVWGLEAGRGLSLVGIGVGLRRFSGLLFWVC